MAKARIGSHSPADMSSLSTTPGAVDGSSEKSAEWQSRLDSLFAHWRTRIFVVTWLSYAGLYLTRKSFAVAKILVGPGTAIGLSKGQMAGIDTAYSCAYALGQFIFGVCGDRFGTRRVVMTGLVCSVAVAICMGMSSTAMMFGVCFFLQGLCQATGWAPLSKNLSHFFSRRERGSVMGMWCTNYAVGGWVATIIASRCAQDFGWRAAFWIPAGLLFVIAVVFWLWQRDRPEDVGLPSIDTYHGGQENLSSPMVAASSSETPRGLGISAPPASAVGHEEPKGRSALEGVENPFSSPRPQSEADDLQPQSDLSMDANTTAWRNMLEVLNSPMVLLLCFTYFLLKPTRYLLLFWGPAYIHETLGSGVAASGFIASTFELGGPLGALLAGVISDKLCGSRRIPVSVVSLLALGAMLYFLDDLPPTAWAFSIALFFIGVFLYAADSLLSGTSAVDFGTKNRAATASGLINGMGSVGQILGPAIPLLVPESWGWHGIFSLLSLLAITAAALILPKWNALPRSD